MSRPIQAVVHLDALQHNLQVAKAAAPQSEVYAVVKANAYGHGIERVYPALQQADGFALLELSEAQRLRQLGWQGKILLLEGIFSAEDLEICAALQLGFAVHSQHQIDWLLQFAQQHPQAQFEVYVKLNSGMNRLGFSPEVYRQVWQQLQHCPSVQSLHHMMHFSDADGSRFGEDGIAYQLKILAEILQEFPAPCSLSNSAAILRHRDLGSDVVRSGIMLYGSSPDYPAHNIDDWQLKPTMSLRSEIIAIQHISKGQSLGYGSNFVAEQDVVVGIVACGYADGYQRISPTGTPVLVNGQRSRTLGRVSMDMLAVDLSHVSAEIGSEVVLWGQSKNGAVLAIDEVAASSGTLGYELMCAVTARVPFIAA